MTETDPVVRALEDLLERSDSCEGRLALGEHLAARGRSDEALAQFEAGVRMAPSPARLERAAQAALAAGQEDKALMYRRWAETLPVAAEPSPEAVAPPRETPEMAAERRGLRLVASDGQALESPAGKRPISFADIGGMQSVKDRLTRSVLSPLRHPEMARHYGTALTGGLVLYGPPGCGKTMFARALAHEIKANFVSVGLADVLDMWQGESERKLHALFESARRLRPSVIFFDEIDGLGQRRTSLRGSAGRNLVNQLLSEMDGFDDDNAGLFFLGATDHPWDLDPALRRPGRFDRLVFVPPPDVEARARILELQLASCPARGPIDVRALVARTDGFSGADLAALVRASVESALDEAVTAGVPVPLEARHLERALSETRPSARAWFETARNYAIYASEGGTFDELLAFLKTMRLA